MTLLFSAMTAGIDRGDGRLLSQHARGRRFFFAPFPIVPANIKCGPSPTELTYPLSFIAILHRTAARDFGRLGLLSMKKWDILIGIPCYDRKLYVDTATSITNTVVELLNLKARAAIFTLSGCALITHARNAIVSEFLARKEKTHLLFIDSDMEWMPNTVLRMLRANVPFSAAPYVQKKYNNSLTKAYNPKDLDSFHGAAMDWNVELEDADVLKGEGKLSGVVNGFVKVPRVGAGLMLLRRDMLETMISKYADTQYRWDGRMENSLSSSTRHFGLFDLLKEGDGGFIGEDYAFCDRWVKGCGGEIWCDIEAKIGHHGHHRYSSSLNESLRLRRRVPA